MYTLILCITLTLLSMHRTPLSSTLEDQRLRFISQLHSNSPSSRSQFSVATIANQYRRVNIYSLSSTNIEPYPFHTVVKFPPACKPTSWAILGFSPFIPRASAYTLTTRYSSGIQAYTLTSRYSSGIQAYTLTSRYSSGIQAYTLTFRYSSRIQAYSLTSRYSSCIQAYTLASHHS